MPSAPRHSALGLPRALEVAKRREQSVSIACGIRVGRLVALAADTRLMANLGGQLVTVSDDDSKIHFWGGGFITGVGYATTLRDAALRLAANEIRTTDDVTAALSAGWDESLAAATKANPGHDELAAVTAMYVSVWIPEGPVAGVFAPGQLGPGLRTVPEGAVFGSPPADLPRAEWSGICSVVDVKAIEGDGEGPPIHAVRTLARVVDQTARRSSQISPIADVCVHRPGDGGQRIWRVRGDARAISEARDIKELAEFERKVEHVTGGGRAF